MKKDNIVDLFNAIPKRQKEKENVKIKKDVEFLNRTIEELIKKNPEKKETLDKLRQINKTIYEPSKGTVVTVLDIKKVIYWMLSLNTQLKDIKALDNYEIKETALTSLIVRMENDIIVLKRKAKLDDIKIEDRR